ncbi:RsiW-degrading membrane proteinase PrsW (M82 family) [Paenibacillus sp. V4I3]|uniref:PrsW family glutamic-type intramembrane protease n=1 Tax=unclassified Paenibacillus TaxID=185978 RepID=UPI002781C355|nr:MULTISPECIES: PrsW family glutamic-type intramembrane protease [unclassified Paenibacillus]MDQ0871631.1 RsiW-degrading membrane proteinase PrsW (M82 family) [Paenibacillus sp. V4I3]MDQ0884950.1 RsiW-degrading membrane proteinase PrsW (M82 family) [Paenibacillus sp. V4I9]
MIIALLFFDTLGVLGRNVIFIGLIEEAAKVLAILFCLRNRKYHFILNGLLVGAAVGSGFAAFE